MQFPKELRLAAVGSAFSSPDASMKCSSRRNCDPNRPDGLAGLWRLNEVQFPKELRLDSGTWIARIHRSLNEVQFPKELRLDEPFSRPDALDASMKCSSRRNCDGTAR